LAPKSSAVILSRVKLKIAWIGKTKSAAIRSLSDEYVQRLARYLPTEAHELTSETALLKLAATSSATLVLLDAGGKQLSSEQLAEFIEGHQNRGTPALLFAIGPADGFSEPARQAASFQLAFGKMTLAHEIARIVLLEQLYRAFTILKGHPYHLGH
jgi:23S rRNA (pseudouridine1915-N3)-methyltransferase